jgi:hypothetical protein
MQLIKFAADTAKAFCVITIITAAAGLIIIGLATIIAAAGFTAAEIDKLLALILTLSIASSLYQNLKR